MSILLNPLAAADASNPPASEQSATAHQRAAALVSVPAVLGPRVRSWLTMLLMPTPIMATAGPGDHRWLFLCQPGSHLHPELLTAGVRVTAPIAGTGPTLPDGGRWIVSPGSGPATLPELSSVVYAVRRALAERAFARAGSPVMEVQP